MCTWITKRTKKGKRHERARGWNTPLFSKLEPVWLHAETQLLVNRPLLSSRNSHFQNKGQCKTFLVKMSFICMRIENPFHINGSALSLALTLWAPVSTYKSSKLISIQRELRIELRKFDNRSRQFLYDDHFINSHNLYLDSVWILLGENWPWSLLGLKGF